MINIMTCYSAEEIIKKKNREEKVTILKKHS